MEILTRRKKCPKCGEGSLHTRVKRHYLIKLFFFWLPLRRYKCDMCYSKTYIFGDHREHLFIIEVDHEQKIIVLERLKRGVTLSSVDKKDLHPWGVLDYKSPNPSVLYEEARKISAPDFTGHYTFDGDADLFLKKVIEESGREEAFNIDGR